MSNDEFDEFESTFDHIDFDQLAEDNNKKQIENESAKAKEIDELKEGGDSCDGGACAI